MQLTTSPLAPASDMPATTALAEPAAPSSKVENPLQKTSASGSTTTEPAAPGRAMQPLRMTREVYTKIRATIGKHTAETGGMLGGDREKGIITHYEYDETARRSGATYSPDHHRLTELLRQSWNPAGVKLMGFVHSHPPGCRAPSGGDHVYAESILRANDSVELLFLPLVMSAADTGKFEMLPYIARRAEDGTGVDVLRVPLELVEEADAPSATTPKKKSRAASKAPQEAAETTAQPVKPAAARFDTSTTFARVGQAYDLERMARSRIIAVGAGGAAAFLEEMARAGVEEFVLVDPDTVSETNLATQQVYRRDIGRPKVVSLAERLLDINPNIRVRPLQCGIELIDDAGFHELAAFPMDGAGAPARTLLCGFTDNFEAQARVNRLALHFGLPSLCAQLYRMGRGLELTFTFPGFTPACHRCILSGRYESYLHQGFKNDVGSHGTPIFATSRLNALKGFVTLGLLHFDEGASPHAHPATQHWSSLLRRIGHRNLAWVRTHPDLEMPAFAHVFSGADANCILFDETIWRRQTADGPGTGRATCPDCGGTGDLRRVVGTYSDTRPMRQSASREVKP